MFSSIVWVSRFRKLDALLLIAVLLCGADILLVFDTLCYLSISCQIDSFTCCLW